MWLMADYLQEVAALDRRIFPRPDQLAAWLGGRTRVEVLGLASRCEVRAGNFFEEVPAGGDAYMLSHIIHD